MKTHSILSVHVDFHTCTSPCDHLPSTEHSRPEGRRLWLCSAVPASPPSTAGCCPQGAFTVLQAHRVPMLLSHRTASLRAVRAVEGHSRVLSRMPGCQRGHLWRPFSSVGLRDKSVRGHRPRRGCAQGHLSPCWPHPTGLHEGRPAHFHVTQRSPSWCRAPTAPSSLINNTAHTSVVTDSWRKAAGLSAQTLARRPPAPPLPPAAHHSGRSPSSRAASLQNHGYLSAVVGPLPRGPCHIRGPCTGPRLSPAGQACSGTA